jgi:drug/metabolite transporter (DMT)-like permease
MTCICTHRPVDPTIQPMKRSLAGLSPRVLGALGVVCVVWGSTYFAIRVGLESFPPMLMGAVRFLVAGMAMYAVLRARGVRAPTAKEWRGAAYTGALLLVVGNGFVNVAERHVSSSVAAVLVATMPLWAAVFARLFGERASAGELAGIALGFLGVGVLNMGGDLRGEPLGAVFALLAPMSWALGSVLARRVTLPAGPMATAAQMLTGGAAMGVVGLLSGERMTAWPTARAAVAVGYLVVFGSMVAFSAYGYLLRHARPVVATSYAYVNPLVAVTLGVAWGGETVSVATLAGAAVILGGVGLLSRARSRGDAGETVNSAA